MLGLTPDEKKVVVFFAVVLALGNGVLLYKRTHMSVAPELKYLQADLPIQLSGLETPKPAVADSAGLRHSDAAETGREMLRVDLNLAGQKELERLPYIGPAMAKRIIDFRKTHGGFRKKEDLMRVRGIGEKTYNKISGLVFVDH